MRIGPSPRRSSTNSPSKPEWRAPAALDVARPAAIANEADTHTLTRPIFSKFRRPSPQGRAHSDEAATAPRAPLPAGLIVKAVVAMGASKSAFVRSDALPEGQWMKEGETIQGWTITALHDFEVVLKNGAQSAQLIIDYSSKGVVLKEATSNPAVLGSQRHLIGESAGDFRRFGVRLATEMSAIARAFACARDRGVGGAAGEVSLFCNAPAFLPPRFNCRERGN